METSVRIAGEAGQGIETAGQTLVKAFAEMGLYVFSTRSYMSRVRGGLNWFDIRIADSELFSPTERPDLLVSLTEEGLQRLGEDTTGRGLVLFDGEGTQGDAVGMPFTDIAKDTGGSKVMANIVAAGTVFGLLEHSEEHLFDQLQERFQEKSEETARKNIDCAREGIKLASEHSLELEVPQPAQAPCRVYDGSEAVGLGAATAGVKFVTAYPMTPATAAFTFLASHAEQYGIVVEQAEDEIAAVNMVCGATYAGLPAMTATSGGGFALMCEGLSLAGMMELPIVIMVAQRPGPATGLPTRTAQQDLKFVLHAGHGEFPRAVFAPGTPRQAYEITRRALESAHKFQSPAILLTDQFLADFRRNCDELDATVRPIDRHILKDPPEDYARYEPTDTGVSPRALPGSVAFVVCDSDEHNARGHITENFDTRIQQQDKRMAKLRGLAEDALPPTFYGPADAGHLMLCWGSSYGPCREAADLLNEENPAVAMMHFPQVWPLDEPGITEMLSQGDYKSISCVEGNATGQFASILKERGLLHDCRLILRYDGLPLTGAYIARRFKNG